MKKISVTLISLILLLGTIGIGSVFGCAVPEFYVTNHTVHVGEFITVVAVNYSSSGCINPNNIKILEEDCSTPSDKAILVSSKCEGDRLTVTYRAVKQGTVKFEYVTCSEEVTILPKSHPMLSFMKILGFGKSD
ncbi:MAG: hypothetical protein KO464_07515 [Candidatus Methanofastidiosum sp.]|nr:hypothetical protein [Methanofastidiosum sp.]